VFILGFDFTKQIHSISILIEMARARTIKKPSYRLIARGRSVKETLRL
jgi:hypothetical protein